MNPDLLASLRKRLAGTFAPQSTQTPATAPAPERLDPTNTQFWGKEMGLPSAVANPLDAYRNDQNYKEAGAAQVARSGGDARHFPLGSAGILADVTAPEAEGLSLAERLQKVFAKREINNPDLRHLTDASSIELPKGGALENLKKWFGNGVVSDDRGLPLPVHHANADPSAAIQKFVPPKEELGYHFGSEAQAGMVADRNGVGTFADPKALRDAKLALPYDTPWPHGALPGGDAWTDPLTQKYGDWASRYAREQNTYPLYTNIKNPVRLVDKGHWSPHNVIGGLGELPDQGVDIEALRKAIAEPHINRAGQIHALREGLDKQGFDGAVYKNTFEVPLTPEVIAASREYDHLAGYNPFEGADAAVKLRELYGKLKAAKQAAVGDSWMAWNPNAVKSAIANSGKYSLTNSNIMKGVLGALGAGASQLPQDPDQ